MYYIACIIYIYIMYDMLCIYLHDNGMEPKWPPTVCATFSRVLVALCAPQGVPIICVLCLYCIVALQN